MQWVIPALLIPFFQEEEGWWNRDWAYRRKLILRNPTEKALQKGQPVRIVFHPGFLGMDRKCLSDYRDLRVLHGGRVIPCQLADEGGGRRSVTFRLAEELGPGRSAEYTMYYGNPKADLETPLRLRTVSLPFDRIEDLKRFQVDPGLQAEIRAGKLRLSRAGTGAGTLRMPLEPEGGGFRLRMRLGFSLNPGAMSGAGTLLVRLRPKPPPLKDDRVEKEIRKLIEELGADEYEIREKATVRLIEIGFPAVPFLQRAAKEISDPEVQWRCRFVLQEVGKKEENRGVSVRYVFSAKGQAGLFATVSGRVGEKQGKPVIRPVGPGIDLEIINDSSGGKIRIVSPRGIPVIAGHLVGVFAELRLEVSETRNGAIEIDELQLEPYLDAAIRPVSEIDVEEPRPE